MIMKSVASTIAAFGLIAAASSPAYGYVVLDGWKLDTTSGSTSNIGRINLVSGTALVEQEVNGSGNVFVGAQFKEAGTIYSVTYTPENVAGAGDTGAPAVLHTMLTISFADVFGEVTALNSSGGFEYNFTSGSFLISAGGGGTASGSIVGIGGNAASTNIIGGVNGDSTILASILSTTGLFNFYDSANNLLNPGFATGDFLFEAVTNNNLTGKVGAGICTFNAAAGCLSFSVASGGDAYIVQRVSEPATLGLLGLGLLGMGFAARKRKA